jgi:hypothetical protein
MARMKKKNDPVIPKAGFPLMAQNTARKKNGTAQTIIMAAI